MSVAGGCLSLGFDIVLSLVCQVKGWYSGMYICRLKIDDLREGVESGVKKWEWGSVEWYKWFGLDFKPTLNCRSKGYVPIKFLRIAVYPAQKAGSFIHYDIIIV